MLLILWYIEPMLGNNREISSYAITARYWFYKQQPLLGNDRSTQAVNSGGPVGNQEQS
jgi:hypothetical protein